VWKDRKYQEDQFSGSELNEESINAVKVVYPRTGHEGAEGSRGITLLFL
jgi:hypothetical protein